MANILYWVSQSKLVGNEHFRPTARMAGHRIAGQLLYHETQGWSHFEYVISIFISLGTGRNLRGLQVTGGHPASLCQPLAATDSGSRTARFVVAPEYLYTTSVWSTRLRASRVISCGVLKLSFLGRF